MFQNVIFGFFVPLLFLILNSCHKAKTEQSEKEISSQPPSPIEEVVIKGEKLKLITNPLPVEPSPPPPRPFVTLRKKGIPPHPNPTSPDPMPQFSLEDALKEIKGEGDLYAIIKTTFGRLYCKLFPEYAPKTVANFVGLATGKRFWWDGWLGEWVQKPFYDGLTFHRVIPDFVIQGGDPWGTGEGGPGYYIPLEVTPNLSHDSPGILGMAHLPEDPNTNGSQFYITDGKAPHLNGKYTIFGKCNPTKLVSIIARVPQTGSSGGNRPLTDVIIEWIKIEKLKIDLKEKGGVDER